MGLREHPGSGRGPQLGWEGRLAVPHRSPTAQRALVRRRGPGPGPVSAGWRRMRLLRFLRNSSLGLPPASVAGKSMCSDSIISQVASLQVHCAGKGDISGQVCMEYIYIHTHTPFPPFPTHLHLPAQGSLESHSLCTNAFVETLICVCARPLMAGAQVCSAYLSSALVTARNVPLIMHLWKSAVWEPSNYPTVAFPASVSSQLGLH